MAKPMLKNIPAFDANVGYGINKDVEIVYSGIAKTNKLYVYESDTNRIVIDGYENDGATLIIPANVLSNNKSYYCSVSVINIDDEETDLSDYVFFTCYTTPSLYFNNLDYESITYNSSVTVTLSYTQAEGRDLLSYIYYIYEYNSTTDSYENTPLSQSTTYYDSNRTYTFKGLETGKTYYIRAVGDTVDGMVVDTGYYKVIVRYLQPSDSYYIMDAENYPVCGWIQYKTNIRIVEGKFAQILATGKRDGFKDSIGRTFVIPFSYGMKTVFDGKVDCTDGVLVYDKGWSTPNDFMLRVDFENMSLTGESDYPCVRLLDTEENDVAIYLNKYEDNDDTFLRFKLVAKTNLKEDENILNFASWSGTKVQNGKASFVNHGLLLTATAGGCYTNYLDTDFPKSARIPVVAGETITLSWDENTNTSGVVAIYPNGKQDGYVFTNNSKQKCLSYTATDGVEFVTFSFGVTNAGDSILYKNITIRDGRYGDNYFLGTHDIKKYILYSPKIYTSSDTISGSLEFNRINNLYSITSFNIT